jgi:hypothetical protein
VWDEIEQARNLCRVDLVIAVNGVGVDYPGHIDHWVSFHLDLLPHWAALRVKAGRSHVDSFWTSLHTGSSYYKQRSRIKANYITCQGGSSGLIGVMVGLKLADRVMTAGIPMDPDAGQYDTKDKWDEALRHRLAWVFYRTMLQDRVKSFSGWTMEQFGHPNEWYADEKVSAI